MNREISIRKTSFSATPYCDGWYPTSLYGWRDFRVKVKDRIETCYIDISKALTNRRDDHCRADANLFKEKIEMLDELWIRDDYIIKRFASWFASTKDEVNENYLVVSLDNEYIFKGKWLLRDRFTLVFEVSR